jgi:AcrR family transcriptional regulator
MAKPNGTDKRRAILDAAIKVFARKGFHASRVSEIADEAGVAYGLVYHYFKSKEALLSELFSERWALLLEATARADESGSSGREKIDAVAGFIIESYRHDPDLMKVVIVEVTRAANSFGRTHIDEITRAHEGIGEIVAKAQAEGEFRSDIDPRMAGMWFYGLVEQLLTGWIFGWLPAGEEDFARARASVVEMVCAALEAQPATV